MPDLPSTISTHLGKQNPATISDCFNTQSKFQ
jgi:hypothetical protein